MQLRGLHVNKNRPGAGDYAYSDAPFVYFSGQAGGRFWNLPYDLGPGAAVQNVSAVSSEYRTIKVEGTTHPLTFYQWNSERSPAHPQTEVAGSRDVTIVGLKMEVGRDFSSSDPSALPGFLRIRESDNVLALGGSGNYHIEVNDSIVEVADSENVIVAGLQRQNPDNSTEKCFVSDEDVCTPYNNRYMSYYRRGVVTTLGEMAPMVEEPEFDGGVSHGDAAVEDGGVLDAAGGSEASKPGQDAADGEDGSGGPMRVGPEDEASGCACSSPRHGRPVPAAVLLVIAAGLFRHRRR